MKKADKKDRQQGGEIAARIWVRAGMKSEIECWTRGRSTGRFRWQALVSLSPTGAIPGIGAHISNCLGPNTL